MSHPDLAPGTGDVLMFDDGAGAHAARGFDQLENEDLKVLDGGALGLSLLARVEFRGALIGVEPDRIEWGLEPTPAVASALPEMRRAARALVESWAS